jgi:hypothetical protein
MSTNLPGTLDSFTDPAATDALNSGVGHHAQHSNANDAILAIEKMVVGPTVYNVKGYGAVGNGTTDDTTAVQAAITAVEAAGGGVIYFPVGTFLLSPLTITGSGITIVGSGWSSILKLAPSSNDYLIKLSPGSGSVTIDISRLAISGNASNQTSGGCIYAPGSVQSRFDSIHFSNAFDACLYLYENTSSVFGHHNRVTRCLFDNLNNVAGADQRGILMHSNDENYIAFCDFENWGGLAGSLGSNYYAIHDQSAGLQVITSCVFVGGQTGVQIDSSSGTRVIGCTFDGVGSAGVHANGSRNAIIGNLFTNGSSTSNGAAGQCEIDNSSSATVVGNVCSVTTTGVVRNCIRELGSSSNNSIVADNIIDMQGSLYSTNPAIQLFGTHSKATDNPGWNPATVTAPAFPATTVAYTNGTGVDLYAHILNGAAAMTTVVNGNTGPAIPITTHQTIFIPAGGTFTPTYASGSPTWVFQGN